MADVIVDVIVVTEGDNVLHIPISNLPVKVDMKYLLHILSLHKRGNMEKVLEHICKIQHDTKEEIVSTLLDYMTSCNIYELCAKYKNGSLKYKLPWDLRNPLSISNISIIYPHPQIVRDNLRIFASRMNNRFYKIPCASVFSAQYKNDLTDIVNVFSKIPEGVSIAGGSVASTLFDRCAHDMDQYEDIDLWITGPTRQIREQRLKTCLEWLGSEWIYSIRGPCITLISKSHTECPNIQVIYTNDTCVEDLVSRYDLPMVKCFYAEETLYATDELLIGRHNKHFILDVSVMTPKRWPKCCRYGGISYSILCSNDAQLHKSGVSDAYKDLWTRTDYGWFWTIPENMTNQKRRDYCRKLFPNTDDVYNKYYKVNTRESLERNMFLAQKALSSDHVSDDWKSLLQYVNYNIFWNKNNDHSGTPKHVSKKKKDENDDYEQVLSLPSDGYDKVLSIPDPFDDVEIFEKEK